MKTRAKSHILLVISGLALATAPGHAQTNGPLPIIWQATHGPTTTNQSRWAIPYGLVQTIDGGFLVATCAGGDYGNAGAYWVIKIDAQGQRQWDKFYHMGTLNNSFHAFTLSSDGGYVLTGFCNWTYPPQRKEVMWTVRCDATGNVLWENSFAPTGFFPWSLATDITRTRDGNYVACGLCINLAHQRYVWTIVKLNDQGQVLWSKELCEHVNFVIPVRVRETNDGGYIIAGTAADPPGSCKTSPYFGGFDLDNWHLGGDFWVVRADAQGNKMWDKSYGGPGQEYAQEIHPLADGGFMVFGGSHSAPVTDPSQGTETSPCYGYQDYWAVRIDAEGNQLWDRSYGGILDDICTYAEPMPDGGWLLAGQSNSQPSGNKTSPKFDDPLDTNDLGDFWLVRIDDQGNKLWEQSLGGNKLEGRRIRPFSGGFFWRQPVFRTTDGGFLLATYSESPISGTKTVAPVGPGDMWVLRLGTEPPSLRAELTAEGQFRLCLIAPPEFSHTIQGSADLVAWMDVVTPPNPTGKVCLTDPDKLTHPFYRAVRR